MTSPFEIHLHRDRVTLPDGTTVTAVSFDVSDPYARATVPDFGVYLDARWEPPWQHERVAWPDFGVPADRSALATALTGLLGRARSGQTVEIGCLGGHGRTGTALACLATLTGEPPRSAVSWVRANYCASAVETVAQENFVVTFSP